MGELGRRSLFALVVVVVVCPDTAATAIVLCACLDFSEQKVVFEFIPCCRKRNFFLVAPPARETRTLLLDLIEFKAGKQRHICQLAVKIAKRSQSAGRVSFLRLLYVRQ